MCAAGPPALKAETLELHDELAANVRPVGKQPGMRVVARPLGDHPRDKDGRLLMHYRPALFSSADRSGPRTGSGSVTASPGVRAAGTSSRPVRSAPQLVPKPRALLTRRTRASIVTPTSTSIIGSFRATASRATSLVNSSSRANRFHNASSGSPVFRGISQVNPRASNAARRNSGVGTSHTA